MKVLVVGNGGREHAIAWKVAQSPLVDVVYCAPGNGGTYFEDKCVNADISEIDELLEFAKEKKIDLTIVGPEVYLVEGIVDRFNEAGLKIFGPSGKAAVLEGSKAFAKDFMKRYGVKTAGYKVFEDLQDALKYLNQCSYPVVIKADGLAAGKGVVICSNFIEAENTVKDFMSNDIFHGSGKRIVIEEYLEGVEASILAVTDGQTILPFISSKDHKRIYDGDEGPNTGGMGAIAPNSYVTADVMKSFTKDIMYPTINGIIKESMEFKGVIFFGIMINSKSIYLLEYNVRMGDPETQAVLPLMKNDFVEVVMSALDGRLSDCNIEWHGGYSCCIVAASEGYPEKHVSGHVVKGLNELNNKMFAAGLKYENDELITSGGRVLEVTATGKTLEAAVESAYEDIKKIEFDGIYYRRDIGKNKG